MAIFDIKTFQKLLGGGTGTITSLGAAFGMPACMLNLTNEAMKLLPSSMLSEMSNSASEARDKADDITKNVVKWLFLDSGIIEFDTEEGVFKFISSSSKNGLDSNESDVLNKAKGLLGAINSAINLGSRLYTNYESGAAQIKDIKDCFERYSEILKYSGGAAADERARLSEAEQEARFLADYSNAKRKLDQAEKFKQSCNDFIDTANAILLERELDPSKEPWFDPKFQSFLSSTGFIVSGPPQEKEPEEVIRLVFGPPRSSNGRFLLSVDGIYYDSQTSGLKQVLSTIKSKEKLVKNEDRWRFDYDPNIGGRGTQISSKQLQSYTNNLFDPTLIDDSPFMQKYYEKDHLLHVINGQKNKRIYDLSGHITELISGGASQSLIYNSRQVLLSEASVFTDKINKRKKQIEIAVKAPSIYGKGALFAPGEVPINDFSYLKEFNLSVELNKQKNLVLRQNEVSGSVLPIQAPSFVEFKESSDMPNLDYLLVSKIGTGAIIDTNSVSSTEFDSMPLEANIVTDNLIAVYNYLDGNVVPPAYYFWNLTNCNDSGGYNNGKLCSLDVTSTFASGLGIAFLNGITKINSTNKTNPSGMGNFIMLPDTTEFNDLLYNTNGATFETWIYMPNLNDANTGFGDATVSALYRIILGCENVGLNQNPQSDILSMQPDFGSNVCRGFLMGITRDRALTQGLTPTNDTEQNYPTSSLSFFIAPTQSYNSSSAFFMKKPATEGGCAVDNGWYCMQAPVSSIVNGKAFDETCGEFMHLVVTFDVTNDTIKVYLDTQEWLTSSISEVFGVSPYSPINLPSFKLNNSFEYDSNTVGAEAPYELTQGPKLNSYTTPWILGGGYTDGFASSGNFMGGSYCGIQSGLKGFLGSTKFYSKPLSGEEIITNYDAQQDFFKNIQTPYDCWDSILSYP